MVRTLYSNTKSSQPAKNSSSVAKHAAIYISLGTAATHAIAASCHHEKAAGAGAGAFSSTTSSSPPPPCCHRRSARTKKPGRAVMWWPWPWPWSWQGTALTAAAWLCLHVAVARLMEALWWRPRRLERHFARHGVRGPGYRFFFGSSIELIRLIGDASSRPAPPEAPHDVLPRVLAFYHHWRKLYGNSPTSNTHALIDQFLALLQPSSYLS